jgi:hypothetical protein
MNGPSDELLERVQVLVSQAPDQPPGATAFRAEDTAKAEALLENIVEELDKDGQVAPQTEEDTVAAAQAWAAAASQVAQVGGSTKRVLKKLLEIARKISAALVTAVKAIGADSFSVTVSAPFGVSVTISWA